MKTSLMAAMALIALATPVRADDAAANAAYERMVQAYAAYDSAALEGLYAPGATYLSRHPKLGIHGRDQILKGMGGALDRMKATGGQIAMKFRIVERKRFGDIIVDNGYIRTSMKPSKDAPEQVTTGKFLLVMAKQPDGRWAFISDADSDTPAEAFDKAVPIPGLKFDR